MLLLNGTNFNAMHHNSYARSGHWSTTGTGAGTGAGQISGQAQAHSARSPPLGGGGGGGANGDYPSESAGLA